MSRRKTPHRSGAHHLARFAAGLSCLLMPAQAQALVVSLFNADDTDVGLNETTAAPSAPQNPATTLGALRQNVMEEAARRWGLVLESDVPVLVEVSFAPLPCLNGAVLGSAGAAMLFRDFLGAPDSNTWYPSALADALRGVDLGDGNIDIVAQFNASIDTSECLGEARWYYGLDHQAPVGKIDLLAVVLHEFAHGLGVSNFVNEVTGAFLGDRPDVYSALTYDTEAEAFWPEMTQGERQISAQNTRKVVWAGAEVQKAVPALLDIGAPVVTTSPTVEGFSGVVDSATFGPTTAEAPVSATLQVAEPLDACTELSPLNGALALVDRGSCTFVTKARNVQAAGGSAMLVRNRQLGSPPGGMSGSGDILIPSLRLSLSDGLTLEEALSDGPLSVTLSSSPTPLGADTQSRLLLHTPSPVQPGSSGSHWAPLATRRLSESNSARNLLMEPNLGADVSDFDVTLALLADLGWTLRIDPTVLDAGVDAAADANVSPPSKDAGSEPDDAGSNPNTPADANEPTDTNEPGETTEPTGVNRPADTSEPAPVPTHPAPHNKSPSNAPLVSATDSTAQIPVPPPVPVASPQTSATEAPLTLDQAGAQESPSIEPASQRESESSTVAPSLEPTPAQQETEIPGGYSTGPASTDGPVASSGALDGGANTPSDPVETASEPQSLETSSRYNQSRWEASQPSLKAISSQPQPSTSCALGSGRPAPSPAGRLAWLLCALATGVRLRRRTHLRGVRE